MDTVRFNFQNDSECDPQLARQWLERKLQNKDEWRGRVLAQTKNLICIYNVFTKQIEQKLFESPLLKQVSVRHPEASKVEAILLKNGNIVIVSQSELIEFNGKGLVVNRLGIDTTNWALCRWKLAEKKNGNVLIHTKIEAIDDKDSAIYEYDANLATLECKIKLNGGGSSTLMELSNGKIVCGGHNFCLIVMDQHYNVLCVTKRVTSRWGGGMYMQSAVEDQPGFVDCIGERVIIRIDVETGKLKEVYGFFGYIDLDLLFQLPLSNGTTAISYSKKSEYLAIVTEPKYLRKVAIVDIYYMVELDIGVVLYVTEHNKLGIVDTETMKHRYQGEIAKEMHVLDFIMG